MNKLILVLLSVFLAACASTPKDTEVYRLTPEELAQLTLPTIPMLSLEEVVKFSQQKMPADDIIAKLKESNSQYDLTPSQIIELSKQGVDAKVLDFIQAERETARLNQLADEINERERINQEEKDRLQRELQRSYRYDPFYDPFFYPYFGYGYYYPHNRLFWGGQFNLRRR